MGDGGDLLAQVGQDPVFHAAPTPYLVLDRALNIRAANAAYTRATLTDRRDIARAFMFDVFPDNPAQPDADGVANLSASFERVLSSGHRDYMGLQRYDVAAPADTDTFVRKVWAPVNAPVRDADGRTVGILHHVEDVTDLVDGLVAADAPDTPAEAPDPDATGTVYRMLHSLNQLRVAHREELTEKQQLRDAMRTRAVIEQAKGILMGQRGCSAEEAFALLVRLSQDANIKLRRVAEQLVTTTGGVRADRPPPV